MKTKIFLTHGQHISLDEMTFPIVGSLGSVDVSSFKVLQVNEHENKLILLTDKQPNSQIKVVGDSEEGRRLYQILRDSKDVLLVGKTIGEIRSLEV